MNKIIETQEPQPFQYLDNDTYYYNYNIQSEEVEQSDMNEEPRLVTVYSFVQVTLYGKPNYNDCVKSIIRSYISEDEEFDLVNSYNKYTLGLSADETDLHRYTDYLQLLDSIKLKVKSDFSTL